MKKLLTLILVVSAASSGLAQPTDNMMGMFFAEPFVSENTNIDIFNLPFDGFIVLLNGTIGSIGGYEVGISISPGIFLLNTSGPNGWFNAGTNVNHIVGYSTPVPVVPGGTVLSTIYMLNQTEETFNINFGPAEPSSTPGTPNISDSANPDIIIACRLPSDDSLVATINGPGIIIHEVNMVIDPSPDSINAPWHLDGPLGYTLDYHGDLSLSGLAPGEYTLTWGDVAEWSSPIPNPVSQTVSLGSLVTYSGNYTWGRANLKPEQAPVPLMINKDQLVIDQMSVQNDGLLASGPFRTGYYLSSDSLITQADDLLATVAVQDLAPAGISAFPETTLTLPSGLTQGRYYLGVLVDDLNAVLEFDESDNFVSTSFEYRNIGAGLPCAYSASYSPLSENGYPGRVDIDGEWAVVGARGDTSSTGAAFVYHRTAASWQLHTTLIPLEAVSGDYFGSYVALGDDHLLIGATGDDEAGADTGALYAFRFNGSEWIQEQKILSAAGQWVVLDGDRFAYNGGVGVQVFRWVAGSWVLEQALPLPQWDGVTALDLSGDVLVAGIPFDDIVNFLGMVRVFRYEAGLWTEEQAISSPTPWPSFDLWGYGVALSENHLAITAPPGGPTPYGTYIYEYTGATWVQQTILPDARGLALEMDGNDLLGLGNPALHF